MLLALLTSNLAAWPLPLRRDPRTRRFPLEHAAPRLLVVPDSGRVPPPSSQSEDVLRLSIALASPWLCGRLSMFAFSLAN
ncbi:hypothetical protein GW17_00001378 [Ensete ventricosum]|nr:hypothetical protein GW17_00001378 [Ensete ventricosum]